VSEPISDREVQVLIQVLDEKYKLEDFTVTYLYRKYVLVEPEIGGITDPVGQLIQWLWEQISGALDILRLTLEGFIRTTRDQIISAITTAINTLGSSLTTIINSVLSVVNTISTNLLSLATSIEEWFNTISKSLTSLGLNITSALSYLTTIWDFLQKIGDIITNAVSAGLTTILDSIKKLRDLLGEVITTISNTISEATRTLQDWIAKALQGISGSISAMWTALETLGITTINTITDSFTDFKNWIWTWLQGAFATIHMGLTQLSTALQTFSTTIIEVIRESFGALTRWFEVELPKHFEAFLTGFGEYWTKVETFFKERYNQLVRGVDDLTRTMQGFVNPLIQISQWLRGFPDIFQDMVSGVIETLKGLWGWITKTAIPTLHTWLRDFYQLTANALIGLGTFLWEAISGLIKNLASFIIAGLGSIVEWAKGVGRETQTYLTNLILGITDTIAGGIESAYRQILTTITRGGRLGEFRAWAIILGSIFGSQFVARWIHLALQALGEAVNEVRIAPNVAIKIVGAGGETTLTLTHRLGWILKHLAGEIKDYPDLLGRAMIYGIASWLAEPMGRLLNYFMRDEIPITLPDLPMIVEVTRRYIPTRQFNKLLSFLKYFMGLWGYPTEVVRWYSTKAHENYVTILDRFNIERRLPISLIYHLPTPSDFARMMVHDIFGPPLRPLPSFKRAMKMVGMEEDIAKMYYMLHFRYPPLDKLWEFACRTSVGLAWVTVPPYKEEDLGATPALSPAGLNAFARNAEQVRTHLMGLVDRVLKYYAKWHDYAVWSWMPNWTADGLINLDMMADIPMRIDTRWMYKWMIIPDTEVFRITTARAMHPDWIEPITVAECMNALMEERTYARTGLISSFKEGFLTETGLVRKLSHLTNVTILGRSYPVRFLEGEVDLLALRARYDRALDILRDYARDLVRESAENIITWETMIRNLSNLTRQVARSLNIVIAYDVGYWNLYRPVRDVLFTVRTTHRIRIWIRYMMRSILVRFSQGYLTKPEIDSLVEELTERGKLTADEKAMLKDVGEMMTSFFLRQTRARGVLRRLSRGIISEARALEELTKLGLDAVTSQALIEEHAKLYTVSIATLMSYADLIHIPEDLMKKKLQLMGVPEDEVTIILEVFKIKPIKSELATVVRRVLDDFGDGYLTEEETRGRLKTLHQTERAINLLIEASKLEREAKIKKYRVDAILMRLRRAEITIEEARRRLRELIRVEELIDALIERNVREPLEEVRREYTLSVSTLLSYATIVPVPEDLLKKKMTTLGIPEQEQSIILQVFGIRPIRDELATAVRKVLDSYEEALIDEDTCKQELTKLKKRPVEISLLIEASKTERQIKTAKAKIDTVLSRLRRGVIKEDEARRRLQPLIKDLDMLEALIERNVRVYTLSPSTLISMMERVPVPIEWVKEKLKVIGVTEEELKAYLAYAKTAEIEEELRSYMREVANDYVETLLTDEQFSRELDQIATLWGRAREVLGVDWVFLSPDERKLIFEAYRHKRLRKAMRGR